MHMPHFGWTTMASELARTASRRIPEDLGGSMCDTAGFRLHLACLFGTACALALVGQCLSNTLALRRRSAEDKPLDCGSTVSVVLGQRGL